MAPDAGARCCGSATPRCSSAIRRCFSITSAAGAEKIDLGEQWTAMTGLPFVWAFWAGRPGALSRAAV